MVARKAASAALGAGAAVAAGAALAGPWAGRWAARATVRGRRVTERTATHHIAAVRSQQGGLLVGAGSAVAAGGGAAVPAGRRGLVEAARRARSWPGWGCTGRPGRRPRAGTGRAPRSRTGCRGGRRWPSVLAGITVPTSIRGTSALTGPTGSRPGLVTNSSSETSAWRAAGESYPEHEPCGSSGGRDGVPSTTRSSRRWTLTVEPAFAPASRWPSETKTTAEPAGSACCGGSAVAQETVTSRRAAATAALRPTLGCLFLRGLGARPRPSCPVRSEL